MIESHSLSLALHCLTHSSYVASRVSNPATCPNRTLIALPVVNLSGAAHGGSACEHVVPSNVSEYSKTNDVTRAGVVLGVEVGVVVPGVVVCVDVGVVVGFAVAAFDAVVVAVVVTVVVVGDVVTVLVGVVLASSLVQLWLTSASSVPNSVPAAGPQRVR